MRREEPSRRTRGVRTALAAVGPRGGRRGGIRSGDGRPWTGLETFVVEAQSVRSVYVEASSHALADPTGSGEAEQA